MILLPEHKCSLSLVHNEHRDYYQTVEQWASNREGMEWVSEEQRLKAIAEDNVWTIIWYPNTPIGSEWLAAYDLEVLLNRANEIGGRK